MGEDNDEKRAALIDAARELGLYESIYALGEEIADRTARMESRWPADATRVWRKAGQTLIATAHEVRAMVTALNKRQEPHTCDREADA